ncbi:MAG: biotin/lipoate A/B protein ligase family protein [Anaerolineae bacterium]|jgi:lipoate-protein ligase A
MKLNLLKAVSWQDSQLLYHALPRLGREGLNLLAPATPYVCIGYFQDVEQEVDVAFCRENDIPIIRREVGGGAVYLDGDQLFFQMVIHRDNPLIPEGGKLAFYRKFLQAPIEAYRALGIPAEYREVNDIVANDRKVSGCGAAEIGDYSILVGNLIVDFDYEMMACVLRVPDEKFRDKVYKTIRENLSTIKRELDCVPSRDELWSLMADEFTEMLGPLETVTEVDGEWRSKADDLGKTLLSDAWLHRKGLPPSTERDVKIRSGVSVHQRMKKAPGGLIRAVTEVRDGTLAAVSLSGDFFFYPEQKLRDLEEALNGLPVEAAPRVVSRFYEEHGIESPGVTPDDIGSLLIE